MPISETFLASWKYCLSFRKGLWDLSDYPVVIREQKTDLDLGDQASRFPPQRYLARVVNWWTLNGSGNTPAEAMQDLILPFDRINTAWRCDGKSLPRPGTKVPIEFAPSQRVYADPDLTDDFIARVLEVDWAFVSDESSLWDFHSIASIEALHARIKETYGVDVSDIESGNLAEILHRIASTRPG